MGAFQKCSHEYCASMSAVVDTGTWPQAMSAVVDTGTWPRFRCVQATERIAPGTVVCESAALAVVVVEEWKRRACASCLVISEGRLSMSCEMCDQCYYCTDACRAQHAADHAAVCPALRRFASLKRVGKETMAVLRLLLAVLARQHTVPDDDMAFAALQHHPPAFDTAKDEKDWKLCAQLFRAVLEACPWAPSPLPTDDELFAMCSRIDCNVFGVFSRECAGQPRVAMGRNVDLIGHGLYLNASMFNRYQTCGPQPGTTALLSSSRTVAHPSLCLLTSLRFDFMMGRFMQPELQCVFRSTHLECGV